MTTIEYTHYDNRLPVSEVVDDIWYNQNNETLFVDLDDAVYAYEGVPFSVYEEFTKASSLGRFYTSRVKGQYKSFYFGNAYALDEHEVKVKSAPVPKNLTYAADAVVDGKPLSEGGLTPLAEKSGKHASALRTHKVSFVVGDDDKVRLHTLSATSVDEAVKVVESIAQMLDLEFNVKEVTTYFE